MTNHIQTTGMSGGSITTTEQQGESTGDWITRHDDTVSKGTPSGNTLSTNWTSANGSQTVTTTRQPGEGDREFRLRHQNGYLLAMWKEEPLP